MNYFSYLLFLAILSGLSFIILISVRILDFANVVSKQKLLLLKMSLIMVMLAPFIYSLLRIFFWQTLEIVLPDQFIHQISEHSLSEPLTLSGESVSFYLIIMYGVGCFT